MKCPKCKSSKNVEVLYGREELKEWKNSRITAGLALSPETIEKIMTVLIELLPSFFKWCRIKIDRYVFGEEDEEEFPVCNKCNELIY